MLNLVLVGIAVGVASMTISATPITFGIRSWLVDESQADFTRFLGEGLSCTYCVSHWIAGLFAWWFGVSAGFEDWLLTTLILIFVASMTSKLMKLGVAVDN